MSESMTLTLDLDEVEKILTLRAEREEKARREARIQELNTNILAAQEELRELLGGEERKRSKNVSAAVHFLVERNGDQITIEVKGRPETHEVIDVAAIRENMTKAAYGYTDKHIGPRDVVGNKGGSLMNRLRAAMAA